MYKPGNGFEGGGTRESEGLKKMKDYDLSQFNPDMNLEGKVANLKILSDAIQSTTTDHEKLIAIYQAILESQNTNIHRKDKGTIDQAVTAIRINSEKLDSYMRQFAAVTTEIKNTALYVGDLKSHVAFNLVPEIQSVRTRAQNDLAEAEMRLRKAEQEYQKALEYQASIEAGFQELKMNTAKLSAEKRVAKGYAKAGTKLDLHIAKHQVGAQIENQSDIG